MQNDLFFYIIVNFLAVNYSFISWLESQLLRQQFLANQLEMVCGNTVFVSFVLFQIPYYLHSFLVPDCNLSFYPPLFSTFAHVFPLSIFYFTHMSFPSGPLSLAVTCLGKRKHYFNGVVCGGKYTCRAENLAIKCNL